MDFRLTEDQERLRQRCLTLAADFATRSAEHDRDASHPTENYDRLRAEGFLALTVDKCFGGQGFDFLSHTIAYEALGQGCPATALAFNMHASVVMPLLQSPDVTPQAKQYLAGFGRAPGQDDRRQLLRIRNNFPDRRNAALSVRARPVDGGYSISGRKMFASMLEATDYVLVLVYPETATSPNAGMLVLIPSGAPGRGVNANWDTLGMRATRSDSLVLDDCRVPDEAVLYRSDDLRSFRAAYLNWFWGSYTAVYLGLAVAAYDEIRRVVKQRQPQGYAQPLAYHPDVRRHIATMSATLEAARLVTYRSAWLSDTQGPTPRNDRRAA